MRLVAWQQGRVFPSHAVPVAVPRATAAGGRRPQTRGRGRSSDAVYFGEEPNVVRNAVGANEATLRKKVFAEQVSSE